MKTQQSWASPELRATLNYKTWKQAGVALAAAASFLLAPSLAHAQADPTPTPTPAPSNTTPAVYLWNELHNSGVVQTTSAPYLGLTATAASVATSSQASINTATQTQITGALKAILADTSNASLNTADSNPGLFITYILNARTDATAYSASLVTAAIQGLQQSAWAGTGNGSSDPVTTDHIVSIAKAAADVVATQQAALVANPAAITGTSSPSYKTWDLVNAKNASLLATAQASAADKIKTTLVTIAQNAVSTTIPVGVQPSELAASIFTSLSTVTYATPALTTGSVAGTRSVVTLPADRLGAIAGALVTKLNVTQQAAGGTAVATAYVSAVGLTGSTAASTCNSLVVGLVKNLPATAVGNAFTVLQTAAPAGTWTGSNGVVNTQALLKNFTAATDIPKIAAITADIFTSTPTFDVSALATMPLKTGSVTNTTQAVRGVVLAGVAAGAAKANPDQAGTIVTTALAKETGDTTVANNASATDKTNLIKNVVAQLAPVSSTGVASAISAFVSSTGSAMASYPVSPTNTAKAGLAVAIINAAAVGVPATATGTASLIAAVAGIGSLADVTSDTLGDTSLAKAIQGKANLLKNLVGSTAVPATTVGFNSIIQTIASTAQTNWDVGAVELADKTLGLGSNLTLNVKAQVAAGIIKTSTANAVIISGTVASQYTGATATANVGAIAAAVLGVVPTQASAVLTPLLAQIDLNPGGAVNNGTKDADRKSFANLLAKSNASLSGTIATIVATTPAAGTSGFFDATDPLATRYDVANGVISANPLNATAVQDAVTALFPSSSPLSDQVVFAQKTIAGTASAAVSVAKQIGSMVVASGTTLSAFVSTPGTSTVVNGNTVLGTKLYANAQIANIAAGFAQANGGTPEAAAAILPAVLGTSSANGGAIVSTLVSVLNIPGSAAALSGSAANIVGTAGVSGTTAIKTATVAVLGGIANKVALVLSGSDAGTPARLSAVATELLPYVGDFHAATKTLPPVYSGSTTAQRTTYDNAVKAATTALNAQITTRIGDLGSLAGAMLQNVTDSASINAVIQATTTGTIGDIKVTGAAGGSQGIALGDLIASTVVSGTIYAGNENKGLITYGVKAVTGIAVGSAVPFVSTYLSKESSLLGLGTTGSLTDFASGIINGANAKAKDIAQGTAVFSGNTLSSVMTLSGTGELASKVNAPARANTAAGLVQAVVNVSGSSILPNISVGNAIGTIAGNFAAWSNHEGGFKLDGSSIADAAIISMASAVATVAPIYAWKVAGSVVTSLVLPGDRVTLAKTLITAISAKLTGASASERIGQLVAAVCTGLTDSNIPQIAAIVAKAIGAKTTAAYDIFGSVVAATGISATALRDALTNTAWSNAGVATVSDAVKKAIIAATEEFTAGSAGAHFYTTGDMTGQETSVTNH